MAVTVYNTLHCQPENKTKQNKAKNASIKVDGDRLLSVFRESGFSCTILPVFLSLSYLFFPLLCGLKRYLTNPNLSLLSSAVSSALTTGAFQCFTICGVDNRGIDVFWTFFCPDRLPFQ